MSEKNHSHFRISIFHFRISNYQFPIPGTGRRVQRSLVPRQKANQKAKGKNAAAPRFSNFQFRFSNVQVPISMLQFRGQGEGYSAAWCLGRKQIKKQRTKMQQHPFSNFAFRFSSVQLPITNFHFRRTPRARGSYLLEMKVQPIISIEINRLPMLFRTRNLRLGSG
jgi:hypothetical protein